MSTPTTPDPNASPSPKHQKGRPTQSEKLVQLAKTRFRFVRDMQGEPYAVRLFAPFTAVRLMKSAELRAVLAREYRNNYGSTVCASALDEAISELAGEGFAAPKTPIHVRIAPHGPGFVLDLGREDGVVVVAEPEGWKLTKDSPVIFKRNDFTHAMRNPERGGDLDLLRRHFRMAPADIKLFCGYLVSVFFPQRQRPILLLQGGQGTGKSTAAEMIVAIVDPSEAPIQSPPRDVDSWINVASAMSVVVIDNLSDVQPWLSDALCRSTSGDAIVKRVLYTDSDLHVRKVRASVILTTIDPGALRGDLGDRVLQLVLESFPRGERREKLEVLADLEADTPLILGAMLDAACAVMRQWKSVMLDDLPRMADFAKLLAAMDLEYGTNSLERFLDKRKSFAVDVAFSDPVVAAVASFMENREAYDGTASHLVSELDLHGVGSNGNRRWVPATLGKALVRASDSLRAIGIEFSRDKSTNGRERRVHFRRVPPNAVRPVRPPDGADDRPASPQNGIADAHRTADSTDGADGFDTIMEADSAIKAFAGTDAALIDELFDYFEECASKSSEAQALLDLIAEIERRRRGPQTDFVPF